MLPWLPFSLKILNSEHFYGTVHLISHFMVSPWMAADSISGLPFYLNWKHVSDFPNVLNSSLAETIYRQQWSNAHVRLCLAGLMDTFVIFLSLSALHPGQMPQDPDLAPCQSSIPFPSRVAARCEQGVPACCPAPAGLNPPLEWQSTWKCHPGPQQLQQVLLYVDRKCSVLQSFIIFSKYS